MSSALENLLVVDFTQVAAGPTCTMMLADRGANVIKIESPTGDLGRQLGPPWQNGQSVIYMALNRNKRSLVLDLKSNEGLLAAKTLIAHADIVVESFRPGVMRTLGLDYEAIKNTNPRLIYCSISAYGQHSPEAGKPGVDGIIQAVTGLMSLCGQPDSEPTKIQAPIIDITTGILATLAIQDALLQRQTTGKGQWLDVSMYESALQLQQTALASYFSDKKIPEPCGSGAPYSAPNEAYPTLDGWIMIAAYHPKRWHAFCQVLGLQQYENDDRFSTSGNRLQNRQQLADIISPIMRTKSTEKWLSLLEKADIICGPVTNYADLISSPAFVAGNYTASFEHKEAGHIEFIRPYTPASVRTFHIPITPAPDLGEHTDEILGSLSKYQ